MAKCFKCGTEDSDTWRFCSAKRDFVCIKCERACSDFSKKLLSNGTNCRLSGVPKKLYSILANSEDVGKLKAQLSGLSLHQLKGLFCDAESSYRKAEQPEQRTALRVRLAALDILIEEKMAQ